MAVDFQLPRWSLRCFEWWRENLSGGPMAFSVLPAVNIKVHNPMVQIQRRDVCFTI